MSGGCNIIRGIAVLAFPWSSPTSSVLVEELALILSAFSHKVIMVTGNKARFNAVNDRVSFEDLELIATASCHDEPRLLKLLRWFRLIALVQVRMSMTLLKNRNDIDVAIFYMAHPYHLLPLVVTRIVDVPSIEVVNWGRSHTVVSKIMAIQDSLTYRLVGTISPQSRALIGENRLWKHGDKLTSSSSRFVDLDRFKVEMPLNEREDTVGFVGRLIESKGIRNLVAAIPLIARERPTTRFVIVGGGPLLEWVRRQCSEMCRTTGLSIEVTGHISRSEIHWVMNRIKVLILPSETEALPTVLLEAMACGTVVLSTPVGGVPDIVRDGITGFIVTSTAPESISECVCRVLSTPNLSEVSERARKQMEQEFSYDAAVERWAEVVRSSMTAKD